MFMPLNSQPPPNSQTTPQRGFYVTTEKWTGKSFPNGRSRGDRVAPGALHLDDLLDGIRHRGQARDATGERLAPHKPSDLHSIARVTPAVGAARGAVRDRWGEAVLLAVIHAVVNVALAEQRGLLNMRRAPEPAVQHDQPGPVPAPITAKLGHAQVLPPGAGQDGVDL